MLKAVEIQRLRLWDGNHVETHGIAEISLKFLYYEPPTLDVHGSPSNIELSLLQQIEKEVQKLADARFGFNKVRIRSEIKRGSLEIVIVLWPVAKAVYELLKDYDKAKNNVLSLIDDLKKFASYLHRVVERHLGHPQTPMFEDKLLLPSVYHYGAVREAVSDENAVSEFMGLMSEWAAILVQIADDHSAESDISAFEAEHAMKDAVVMLLHHLNEKERFRKLTEDEKITEFMCRYLNMAVLFLEEKILPYDSKEKIEEIIKDDDSEVCFQRLEEWLQGFGIFKKAPILQTKKIKDSNLSNQTNSADAKSRAAD
jgi:hypothetical protein